jgi:hypothetical protein
MMGLLSCLVLSGARDSVEDQMTRESNSVVDHSLAERRQYKRERVEISGRQFEPAGSREAVCHIADISLGGARIQSNVIPTQGAKIVVYIDGFGRFEGDVVRSEESGFGIRFTCTEHKRGRLSEQLDQYKNGAPLERTVLRRHGRTTTNATTSFTRASGEVVKCEILDFSLSGFFLSTPSRPEIGEFVLVNGVPGRVARHHDVGIAIEFLSQTSMNAEPQRQKLFAAG